MPHDEHAELQEVAEGDAVAFSYTVSESDVSERLRVRVRVLTDSKYHRVVPPHNVRPPYDDQREFIYLVNPPWDD